MILQCFCECMYVYHTTFMNKFHTFYCIISTKDLFNQIIPIYTFSENITAEFCIFLTKLCITARSENLNSNQSRLFLKTFWFGTTAGFFHAWVQSVLLSTLSVLQCTFPKSPLENLAISVTLWLHSEYESLITPKTVELLK